MISLSLICGWHPLNAFLTLYNLLRKCANDWLYSFSFCLSVSLCVPLCLSVSICVSLCLAVSLCLSFSRSHRLPIPFSHKNRRCFPIQWMFDYSLNRTTAHKHTHTHQFSPTHAHKSVGGKWYRLNEDWGRKSFRYGGVIELKGNRMGWDHHQRCTRPPWMMMLII